MMSRLASLVAICVAFNVPSAMAQDVRNYVYDSQGRLIGSTRSSPSPNDIAGYSFDAADNRTQRLVAVAARPSVPNELLPGQTMVAGQSLSSPNGRAVLAFQSDGNLVISIDGAPAWSTGTGTGRSLFLTMQADGNLVLYAPGAAPLWFQVFNQPGTKLVLQSDCNLVLYTSGGTGLWGSGTSC